MITSWDIYWITRLDSINMFLILFGLFLPFTILFWMWTGDEKENDELYYRKSIFSTIAISIIFLSSACFLPSTKEAAAIYLIPKIVNNQQVQKIPDNAIKLLNVKLEQWIDDTMKIKKEKDK